MRKLQKLRTLNALLPKTRQGILAATLVQPEKAWYASELAHRLGVPSSSLQRELHDLSEAGILKTYQQGRMVYYQANRDPPVFSDLRGRPPKTAGLVDVLAQALSRVAAKVAMGFVHGSIAAGREEKTRHRPDGCGSGVAGGSRIAAQVCGSRWAARLIPRCTLLRNSSGSMR